MTKKGRTIDAPMALVGIDRADQQHAICLQEAGSDRPEASVLKHTPEAIDEWDDAMYSFCVPSVANLYLH